MQHKATAERRYRMELAVVVGVGVLIALVAVIAILTINPAPVEETDDFDSQPLAPADAGHLAA